MSIVAPNRARAAFPRLVVAAVFALAAAIIALGVVGLASAQTPPAAPTNVTVLASGEGFVIGWDASDAATSHWVAWMSDDAYQDARAGDWTTALQYDPVPSGDTHVISSELLVTDADYWIIVGSVSGASPVAWGEWHRETALQVEPEPTDDDALTRAYVEAAVAYYEANGLEATIAFYRGPDPEGRVERLFGRVLRIIDVETQVITAFRGYAWQDGWQTTDIGPGDVFSQWVAAATPEGYWAEGLQFIPGAFQETPEPRRNLFVRHDGLVFTAGHSILRENVAQTTQDYVQRAVDYYESNGRQATIEYYNGRESVDGPFYLFLMDENDIYLVHPINPSLRGTDIKEVVGVDGQELGKEIAQATPAGIWVQYLWTNPVSQAIEDKHTWAIRHDGLIFASGYYAGGDDTGERPAWLDAAPEDYTKTYVARRHRPLRTRRAGRYSDLLQQRRQLRGPVVYVHHGRQRHLHRPSPAPAPHRHGRQGLAPEGLPGERSGPYHRRGDGGRHLGRI